VLGIPNPIRRVIPSVKQLKTPGLSLDTSDCKYTTQFCQPINNISTLGSKYDAGSIEF